MGCHHGHHPSKKKFGQDVSPLVNRTPKIHEHVHLIDVRILVHLAIGYFQSWRSPILLHRMASGEQYGFHWYATLQQLNEVASVQ